MRTVFQQAAAENLLHYLQFQVKKPKGLPARVFAGRVVQLNNYTEHLPCMFYSARANNTTVKATKMSEPALAQLVLRLVPQSWQYSYSILNKGIPQSMEEILVFLEGQEMLERSSVPKQPILLLSLSTSGSSPSSFSCDGRIVTLGAATQQCSRVLYRVLPIYN
jgi:hypothetical protein